MECSHENFNTEMHLSISGLDNNNGYVFVFVFSYRFTQIAVDPQVKTPGGKAYDVLFIGTGKYTSCTKQQHESGFSGTAKSNTGFGGLLV